MDNQISFESKSELLKRLQVFHDRDCSLMILKDKRLQFIDSETKESLFEVEFNEPILNCVFGDRCQREKSKRILTALDLKSFDDLEKLKIEMIDFYFSYSGMVIHASEINPNFVKGGKESFYGDDLYLQLTKITSMGFATK
jgi:hypothetical protein